MNFRVRVEVLHEDVEHVVLFHLEAEHEEDQAEESCDWHEDGEEEAHEHYC